MKVGLVVNVYCYVVAYDTPTQSKGTGASLPMELCSLLITCQDQFVSLKVSDGSVQQLADGVLVRLFAKGVDKLPVLTRNGDVLRLHRVKVVVGCGDAVST